MCVHLCGTVVTQCGWVCGSLAGCLPEGGSHVPQCALNTSCLFAKTTRRRSLMACVPHAVHCQLRVAHTVAQPEVTATAAPGDPWPTAVGHTHWHGHGDTVATDIRRTHDCKHTHGHTHTWDANHRGMAPTDDARTASEHWVPKRLSASAPPHRTPTRDHTPIPPPRAGGAACRAGLTGSRDDELHDRVGLVERRRAGGVHVHRVGRAHGQRGGVQRVLEGRRGHELAGGG